MLGTLIVGLLVGPPLALLRWSRWPITGLPTTEQLRDLPTTVVSDAALLTTLTVAIWAAWAAFMPRTQGEVMISLAFIASLLTC